jgi:hypothetical protein
VFAILLLGGARLTWRTLATAFATSVSGRERRRVVIVGAGRTGATLAREILGSPKLAYDVVGFVDDDRHLRGAMLHNLSVLGTTAELKDLAEKYRLSEAIIAIPQPKIGDLRRIREACAHAGLLFKTLPSLSQLVTGDGQVRYLRKVDIADLLPRAAVPLQLERLIAPYDAFLLPTAPCIPPAIAEVNASDDAFFKWNMRILRIVGLVNFLDGCAASVPCHARGAAPVGLMVCGPAMSDRRILAVAAAVERALAGN